MARILCNVAGGGKPLKGNAGPGDVLVGKTFSNKQSNALTGSMPNNGAWSASTSGNGSVTIPAGYHNGSGTVSGSASYNQGVFDGKNNTEFKLIVDRVLYSVGGNDADPGNGSQSYTLTATQTTWWCAGAKTIQRSGSAQCSGQGSGILYAGQRRTFTAYTTERGGVGSHAVIHISAWVKD